MTFKDIVKIGLVAGAFCHVVQVLIGAIINTIEMYRFQYDHTYREKLRRKSYSRYWMLKRKCSGNKY